jgi:hypothetical protein
MTTDLESLPAVVIQQQSQWAEVIAQAFAVPYESVNKYKIASLPDEVQDAGGLTQRHVGGTMGRLQDHV